jgi:septum formation protein
MLQAAGLSFEAVVSNVDEPRLKRSLEASGRPSGPEDAARMLAAAKAEAVSRVRPEALVIGADQVLAFDNKTFEKPADVAAARRQLMELRGSTHELVSAVVLAEGGQAVWSHAGIAALTMRPFTSGFLDGYLEAVGGEVCQSVGAYQLEGLGAQLFERIEGDYFTILGLPLIALLTELRARGVIAT